MKQELSQQPVPDRAEPNAFFPSAFSLNQFTRSTSDQSGADYAQRYDGGKKILVIATDERYLAMANGTLFSTGNHPVETLLPMYHLHQAGFAFDIATPSGLMVKFEHWAMPCEDAAIQGLYQHYLPQFRRPRRLREVLSALTAGEQDYAGVFIPGGHGALIGLPFDADVAETIRWTMREDRYLIAICHGPAAFLSLALGENPLRGYALCAFPDSADRQTPTIGYMPGELPWFFGDRLQAMGMTLVNTAISGQVHQDRKLLSGDSPFAANALGQLAARTLLAQYGA